MTKPPKCPVRPAKTQISLGAQADLSLRWAQRSTCRFCRVPAHLIFPAFISHPTTSWTFKFQSNLHKWYRNRFGVSATVISQMSSVQCTFFQELFLHKA